RGEDVLHELVGGPAVPERPVGEAMELAGVAPIQRLQAQAAVVVGDALEEVAIGKQDVEGSHIGSSGSGEWSGAPSSARSAPGTSGTSPDIRPRTLRRLPAPASSQRRVRRTQRRRSLSLVSACDEQEDPGVQEADEQSADMSAGQPVEAAEVP